MDEINLITQRVTVMRDGEYVGTRKTSDVSKNEIIIHDGGKDYL